MFTTLNVWAPRHRDWFREHLTERPDDAGYVFNHRDA